MRFFHRKENFPGASVPFDWKEKRMKRITLLAMLFLFGRWAAWAQGGATPAGGGNSPPPALLTLAKVDHWVIHDSQPWDDGERCKTIMVPPGEKAEGPWDFLQVNIEREIGRESLDRYRFHLCSKEPCNVNLKPQEVTPFQLCLDHGFLWPGKYSGTLWLGTKEKPRSFEVIFYVRDRLLRFLGLLLIVVGVGASWGLKIWLKPQLTRLQALAPASYLHLQLAKLGLRLDRLPEYENSLRQTRREIQTYEDELSEEALDGKGLLPPKPPAPINVPAYEASKYKLFLEGASTHLDVFEVVVAGVESVRELDPAVPPAPPDSAVGKALSGLEGIIATLPPPNRETAQALVKGILDTLRAALAVRPAAGAMVMRPAAPAAAHPVYQSYDQIQVKIQQLNSGYWWAWAALTILTGFTFLILNLPLFGNPYDLATAFVWGVGIPTALTTVSSVATALGITTPQI
jgi:hypothetical protein